MKNVETHGEIKRSHMPAVSIDGCTGENTPVENEIRFKQYEERVYAEKNSEGERVNG